jgi:predicted  nucleic acid-binding Zn-ribbon protein
MLGGTALVAFSCVNPLQDELDKTKKELTDTQATLADAQATIADLNGQLDTKQAELTAKQTELTAKQAELTAKQAELDTKQTELDAKQAEIATLTAQKDTLAEAVANLEAAKTALQTQLSDANTTHAEEKSTLQTSIANLEAAKTALQTQLSDANTAHATETAALQASIAELEAAKTALQTQLSDANTAHATEKAALQDSIAELEAAKTALQTQLSDANTAHATEKAALQASIAELEDNITALTTQLETLTDENTAYEAENATLQNSVTQLEGTIATLTAQLEAKTQSLIEANSAIDTLTAEKNALIIERDDLLAEKADLTADINAKNAEIALKERQIEVLVAGGSDHSDYEENGATLGWEGWFAQYDKIMSDIATYKTGGALFDGTPVVANTPIDTLLLGDDVFDRFDDGTPAGSTNSVSSSGNVWDYMVNNTTGNTVNASIAGNTVGDMQHMADHILSLGVNSPIIKHVIVNAGANDLANAGSTDTIEVGSATASVIANKVGRLVAALMGSANINKVAVLTPVYRGNLNSNDQMYLRGGLDNTNNPAYGSTPPDCVMDSWQHAGIQSSISSYFDGNNLSGDGYLALLGGIDLIINDASMIVSRAMPKDKGAIYLASALNPPQHGYVNAGVSDTFFLDKSLSI